MLEDAKTDATGKIKITGFEHCLLYFLASRQKALWKAIDPSHDNLTEDYQAYHQLVPKLDKADWGFTWCISNTVSWYRFARDVAHAMLKKKQYTHIKPRVMSMLKAIPPRFSTKGSEGRSSRNPSSVPTKMSKQRRRTNNPKK